MKKEFVAIFALVMFVAGSGVGYVVADSSSDTGNEVAMSETHNDSHSMEKDDDHEHGEHGEGEHMHMPFEVNADEAPTVALTVTEDAKSGWNISIDTTNFAFTPDSVNGENVIGEGHAHLYVDGEKVARLYGPNFHYDKNFDGTKTFKVTLNGNMHGEYSVDGQVIEDEQVVTHSHE